MLFDNALFYPTIDIEDEGWLKSAVLLWDNISTIVPISEVKPFKQECSGAFADAGILLPYRVDPNSVDLYGLDDAVREYLDSPQGKRSFKRRTSHNNQNQKISYEYDERWKERHSKFKEFEISAEKF